MLQVENLTKRFGDFFAVNNINFEAKPGEILGLLGPNGAGKTTTMKMLSGYLTPSFGNVRIFDMDLHSNSQLKAKLGYLPEGSPSYSDMQVYQFLSFIADIRGLGSLKWQRLAEIIELFQLQDVLTKSIDVLSKGFKKRLGLAQAILHDPKLIILDEPTDGLDPNQKYDMRKIIKNLARNKIIIISTHILEEVNAICDRVILIAHGKIIANSTPAALQARSPKHNTIIITLRPIMGVNLPALFEDLPGIQKIETLYADDARCVLCLYPEKSSKLSTVQIHHLAYQQGLELLDLKVYSVQLDEVFREMTL